MIYLLPHYISRHGQPSPELSYVWDDEQAEQDFQYNPDDLIDRMKNTTTRAKIALCIGIYEWIIWRYHRLSDDPAPFQIAEAAWCGNIRDAYIVYFEVFQDDDDDAVGIPLQDAMNSIASIFNYTIEDKDTWELAIAMLAPLAMHVLPDTKPFEDWLESVTDRLLALYPAPEDDPYDDIFGDHEEERRGPLVAREALDPSFDYRPEQAPTLLDQFLRGVDHASNPFLRSPEELMELGVEQPYLVVI